MDSLTTEIGIGTVSQEDWAISEPEIYIKKPLNAFMLFIKEMKPKIVARCTQNQSASINQILGRMVRHYDFELVDQ